MTRRRFVAPPAHRPGCLTDVTTRFLHDGEPNHQYCRLECGCEIKHGSAICLKEQHKCRATATTRA